MDVRVMIVNYMVGRRCRVMTGIVVWAVMTVECVSVDLSSGWLTILRMAQPV